MVSPVSGKSSIITNVKAPVKQARRGSSKYKPVSAPRGRRIIKTTGKRAFRQFSAKDHFKAKANEAYRIDHSPSALSMRAVKLRRLRQALGMDGARKENQKTILWYWTWSRNWRAKTNNSPGDIFTPLPHNDRTEKEALNTQKITIIELASTIQSTPQGSNWYWRWHARREQMKKTLRSKLPKRLAPGFLEDVASYFGPNRSPK